MCIIIGWFLGMMIGVMIGWWKYEMIGVMVCWFVGVIIGVMVCWFIGVNIGMMVGRFVGVVIVVGWFVGVGLVCRRVLYLLDIVDNFIIIFEFEGDIFVLNSLGILILLVNVI